MLDLEGQELQHKFEALMCSPGCTGLDYVNKMTVSMVTSFKEEFGLDSDLMMKSKYFHNRLGI